MSHQAIEFDRMKEAGAAIDTSSESSRAEKRGKRRSRNHIVSGIVQRAIGGWGRKQARSNDSNRISRGRRRRKNVGSDSRRRLVHEAGVRGELGETWKVGGETPRGGSV